MYRLIFFILCSVAFAQNPYRSINSFNSGELTPLLNAREDLAKYQNGCSIMENLIPLPQGGAQKRPGTKYIAEVKTSSLATRLLPFEFSTSQSYIIEAGNQYMRFFTNGSPVFATYGTEDLSGIEGVIAHWKMNDNAASTTVIDADGATHNGATTVNDTDQLTAADASGAANESLDLGGTDIIEVTDHDDFSFGDSSDDNPFSIIGWLYYASSGNSQSVASKFLGGGHTEYDCYVDGTTDKAILRLWDDTSSAGNEMALTTNAVVDGWHFFVYTYDGRGGVDAGKGIKIYIDWVEQNLTYISSGTYVAMENGTAKFGIGGRDGGFGKWQDKIDNVAVFDKALTVNEIATLTGSDSTTPTEIVTPYLTTDLFDLKIEQSADVLYITHPDYETGTLSRLNNSVWLMNAIGIETGPFKAQNSDVIQTIAANGTTGSVTLTAVGHAPFIAGTTAGHEPSGAVSTSKSQTGALFRMIHPISNLEFNTKLEDNYTDNQTKGVSWMDCKTLYKGAGWTLVTHGTWTGTLEVQRNYTIGAADDADGWESVFAFASDDNRNVSTSGTEDGGDAVSGTEDSGAADYRCILTKSGDNAESCTPYFTTDQIEHIGIVEITAVASTTSATATVLTTLASTDVTYKWSEGAWSNYRGWPQTVTFFEDRLTFGGNTFQPDTIWASVTGDYQNMTAGADDDEALIFTLSSRQVNVIEWIIGKDKLLIGTSGAEWTIAGGTDEPLTPSNAIAKQHSTYGSANLQAGIANESVLFFQRGARKMRELAYNWELDSYVAPDMTILANLVTSSGIVDTAFQKTPDSILWCVRTDGELPVFAYERKENITAWSRMVTTDGTADSDFESIARIHGSPEDEIWVVVKRTINSNPVRYIEQFQPRDFGTDADDAYYVDCGLTYDSTPLSTMTGGTHLIGETVSVLADGVVFDDAVVNGSGEIILKLGGTITTASTVQWGLPYEVHLRTMPLSWTAGDVTIQGRQKKIGEVIVNWYVSGDFSIGRDADTLRAKSISGQTTDQDRITFPPGWDRNGYVYVYQKSPEPLTILALIMEFEVN